MTPHTDKPGVSVIAISELNHSPIPNKKNKQVQENPENIEK